MQTIRQQLTGAYAIVKIFPSVYALKVEETTVISDSKGNSQSESGWRLATDRDILELDIPVARRHVSTNFKPTSNDKE
jgi:hypothetical protein